MRAESWSPPSTCRAVPVRRVVRAPRRERGQARRRLVDWTKAHFTSDVGTERGPKFDGLQYGAEVVSEQTLDMRKMGSHTARWGSILALVAEKTGDANAKERAFRSLSWATYLMNDEGVVYVHAPPNPEGWFSDGYGDYVRHFFHAVGAAPDFAAGGEAHLVRSSSIVTAVKYEANAVRYATYDAKAEDVLRLPRTAKTVTVAGAPIATFTTDGDVVRISRASAGEVVVTY